MTELNQSIANLRMPLRVSRLPISPKGFPVPWFVAFIDGEPDFRVIGPSKIIDAVNKQLCWICGGPLGSYKVFTIGPMCSVNRVSAEPPSHLECAQYAATACPFLTQPRMKRNEKDLPDLGAEPAGIMIKRNPGVTALWVTKSYKPFRAGNGVLFKVGEPTNVFWFAEGRTATRAEVETSIMSGLPLLEAEAKKEGIQAIKELAHLAVVARQYLPKESLQL